MLYVTKIIQSASNKYYQNRYLSNENNIVLYVKKLNIIKKIKNKNIISTKYQIHIKFNTNQFDYLIQN